MSTSPDLGIPFLSGQQAQPEITHNEAISVIQALLYGVVAVGTNSPPGSPVVGDAYVLGASPTGAWSGRARRVAVFVGNAWRFIPGNDSSGVAISMGVRQEGMRVWDKATDATYVWSGTAWTAQPAGTLTGIGAGTGIAVNTTNPLVPVISATNAGAVTSVSAGTGITVDNTNPQTPVVRMTTPAVTSVVAGQGVSIDATNPLVPIVSSNGRMAIVDLSSASHSLDATQPDKWLRFTHSAAAKSYAIDTDAVTPVAIESQFHIRNCAANLLTIVPAVGVTVNQPFGGSLVLDEGMAATLIKVGTDEYDLIGYTVAA